LFAVAALVVFAATIARLVKRRFGEQEVGGRR
jgi:hypothetical protein